MRPDPTVFFDDPRTPNSDLALLLQEFEVEHDGTLAGIRNATQAAWYEAGKFRAQITEKHGHKREEAMPIFTRLGLVDPLRAEGKKFDYALILGSKVGAVRRRADALATEWIDHGPVRVGEVAWLCSTRDLFEDERADPSVNLETRTEARMVERVRNERVWPWMADDADCWDYAIPVKLKKGNTEQTMCRWRDKRRPAPGPCLILSSQPFALDQALAAQLQLPGFTIEVAGPAAQTKLPVSTYLDTIAKAIFKLAQLAGV